MEEWLDGILFALNAAVELILLLDTTNTFGACRAVREDPLMLNLTLDGDLILVEIEDAQGIAHQYSVTPNEDPDPAAFSVDVRRLNTRQVYWVFGAANNRTWRCECMDQQCRGRGRKEHCKHIRAMRQLRAMLRRFAGRPALATKEV